MPVHVENMSSEVSFQDGDAPLSEATIAMLVERVKAALAEDQRQDDIRRQTGEVRSVALPGMGGED